MEQDNVYTLLQKHGNSIKPMGQDYVIHCLNPEHEDRNPSMRVDRNDGKFHCLSCGFKGNIFKYYGVIVNTSSIAIRELKNKLMRLKASHMGLELPQGATPWTKPFRGISKQTLSHFNAFYTDLDKDFKDRIVIPIYDVTNKINSFIGRHVVSDANPKYVVLPRNSEHMLFPQVTPNTRSLILVEGIFDMMQLYDKGVTNVVTTFGTNTVNKNAKDKLLVYKMQGVQKFYILFDGDIPGRKAAKSLLLLIEAAGFMCEIIDLPDGDDPGSLAGENIVALKNYIRGQDESSFN